MARYWRRLDSDGRILCELCPHRCMIAPGQSGLCRVRSNRSGVLTADTYGHPAALQVDPIEKKPLNWYRPGSKTFSIGCFGCNLSCRFCQNDELSRSGSDRSREYSFIAPERIVKLAVEHSCPTVALTYNEPTVFFEYALDIARAAHAAGLGVVLVSNGYINPEPARELYALIDAANIDVKGFGSFYDRLCGGGIDPVLENCRRLNFESRSHLELTNLLIPGENDSVPEVEAFLEWTQTTLGVDTPLHFSAYFPAGGFTAPPTPASTLYRAAGLAERRGFTRISLGNLPR